MDGIEITAQLNETARRVLTTDALAFVGELHRQFDADRQRHLEARAARQDSLDAGVGFSFDLVHAVLELLAVAFEVGLGTSLGNP